MTPTLPIAGIDGDRRIQVRNAHGRTVTSRTHPGLPGHRGTLDERSNPLMDGLPWADPGVLATVRGATLVRAGESLRRS
jgi:hypothetical protein